MESEIKILLTALDGVESVLTTGSQRSSSVGTMKTDFMSFFQDEIKERLKKDPTMDSLGLLYLICVMEEKEVPRSKILECIKEILGVRVAEDAESREAFMKVVDEISAKYTNEWIEDYFGPKNKESEQPTRTPWDENLHPATVKGRVTEIKSLR